MQIELTPEQDRYLRDAIDNGRVEDKEQALQEAVTFWMEKERMELVILELRRVARDMKDEPEWRKLNNLVAMIASAFELETTDDPFCAFDEWNGDADRRAYADL